MAKAKTVKAKPSKPAKTTKTAKTKSATTAIATTNGAAKPKAAVVIPVDDLCPLKAHGKVVDDWDAMLNQTNIGHNNNKYYVIQLVESGGKYHTWTRWGRVGEPGQNALLGNGTLADAQKCFKAKFRDKTSNNWEDRAKFVAKAGKYTLIEIERSADAAAKAAEVEEKLKEIDKEAAKVQKKVKGIAPSKLHPSIERFMNLIFDHDVFRGAMASFDIDVKKMPLGQLTKHQVQKGYEVLEELEDAITAKKTKPITELSSRFYTLIPHAFGRRVPPPINTPDLLQKKYDMLNVLNDIEIALGMQHKHEDDEEAHLLPNPADQHYKKLKADLEFIDPKKDEHDFIRKYMESTGGGYYKLKLIDAFRITRDGEPERFKAHDKVVERKLLWHGTNVAVVAAILGSGLRIMPHSGGRVGKGIYLASENGKSVGYVGWSGNTGVMFLAEAALGKEHTITRDDSSLKAAPKGYDCIVARGHTEPDPAHDLEWEFEGKKVIIPQGKPIKQSKYHGSSFTQSEYLLYKESQVRLRYVLRVQH
jgi:poly [ADP-ribose] polymerase